MVNIFRFVKRNYVLFNRALLFLIAIIITVYFIPGEGKFKFDFTRGTPWKHDDMFAPFTFPIYKTDFQYNAEKDSILKNFKPYFKYDTLQVRKQKEKFYRYIVDYAGDNKKLLNSLLNITEPLAVKNLNFIYERGVLENIDEYAPKNVNKKGLIIIRDNIAEEYEFQEIFTLKTAYEYLTQEVKKLVVELKKQNKTAEAAFLKTFNLTDYLEPNLLYDEKLTVKAKEELVNSVSRMEGRVVADTRIISKGEIITSDKYQVLESLKKEFEVRLGDNTNNYLFSLGKIIFVFVSFLVLYLFLYHFRSEFLGDYLKTVFILFVIVLFSAVSALVIRFDVIHHYIIPFAILPIIIRTFYDDRLALFMHMITILLVGYFVPNAYEFIFLNFTAGIIAIFSLTNLYRRRRIVITAALIASTYCLVYFGLAIVQEGDISSINLYTFAWFLINGVLVLLAYPLIYIFENIFGFLSDVTLMELSDTNQTLLRQMAEEAPGTFQHSLQVANLAEEAVFQIGGNTLLVRAGALYHDIGKMSDSIYFTENQQNKGNLHDNLELVDSAKIIIDHVNKGVDTARKFKLPEPVIDFIKTHHGTLTAKYFYNLYKKKYPDKVLDVNKFKYPGPIPFSKETAVLMMADSVEAASRSLPEVNEESINTLVDNIIDFQLSENQFNNANITFKDISTIKNVFKKKLQNIYHVRISYPE